MRRFARSLAVAVFVLVAAVLLAVGQTIASLAALTATSLIMGGTGHPLSVPPDTQQFVEQYVAGANGNYIAPSGLCGGMDCTLVAVVTPEQFFPVSGTMTFDQSVAQGQQNLNSCIQGNACPHTLPDGTHSDAPVTDPTGYVVYGYSQSATVATFEKRALCASGTCQPIPVAFILVANPNRPNGGILERFNFGNTQPTIPFLGVTFSGATPTNTPYTTVDVAREYDAIADFPTNPLNPLADANALAGYYYLHGNYYGLGAPTLQGQFGDTTYYMFMTYPLPILMPLAMIPVAGPIAVDMLDPAVRVLVESAYDRTTNPGVPTPANFLYFPNPVQLGTGLVLAIPTGLLLGFQDITGARTPGTPPAYLTGPNATYYIGGPPVYAGCGGGADCSNPTPYATTNEQQAASTTSTQQSAPTIPSLISTPSGLIALANPTTLMTDLATFSQLVSVLNGGAPVSIPSLSNSPQGGITLLNPVTVVTDLGAAAGQSFSALRGGVPSATPLHVDTMSAPAPEPKKNSDETIASALTPKAQEPTQAPKADARTGDGPPVSDPKVGRDTVSSTTNPPRPSIPIVTQPSLPQVRLPIGSNLPNVKATRPSADGPVKRVLNGLMGGPKATSSTPSGSASTNSSSSSGKA